MHQTNTRRIGFSAFPYLSVPFAALVVDSGGSNPITFYPRSSGAPTLLRGPGLDLYDRVSRFSTHIGSHLVLSLPVLAYDQHRHLIHRPLFGTQNPLSYLFLYYLLCRCRVVLRACAPGVALPPSVLGLHRRSL